MAEEIENVAEAERIEPPVASERAGSTLPFTLTLVALLIYFGFQTLQLFVERSNLAMVKSNQEGAIQEAQKLQAQFKTLVGKNRRAGGPGPRRRKNGHGRIAPTRRRPGAGAYTSKPYGNQAGAVIG